MNTHEDWRLEFTKPLFIHGSWKATKPHSLFILSSPFLKQIQGLPDLSHQTSKKLFISCKQTKVNNLHKIPQTEENISKRGYPTLEI